MWLSDLAKNPRILAKNRQCKDGKGSPKSGYRTWLRILNLVKRSLYDPALNGTHNSA